MENFDTTFATPVIPKSHCRSQLAVLPEPDIGTLHAEPNCYSKKIIGLAQQRKVKSHRNLLRSPHSGPHPGTPYRPIRVTGGTELNITLLAGGWVWHTGEQGGGAKIGGLATELLGSAAIIGPGRLCYQALTSTKSLFVPGLSSRFETAYGDYQSGYKC